MFSSVQFSLSVMPLTLCDPMNHSTPGLPVHHQLPEFSQTHVHRVGDAIQPSHPLLSPSPPAPNPSQHQSFFFSESTLRMRWPKSWSFSFSIIRSKEIPGLISFRMDWLDLLAVQGTLTSLLQNHTSLCFFQMMKCPFHYRGLECKSRKSRPPGVTGKFGLGVQNEAGQWLREFCQENTLVIANTLF